MTKQRRRALDYIVGLRGRPIVKRVFWSLSLVSLLWAVLPSTSITAGPRGSDLPVLPNPVLFVTQVPQPADFSTIGSVFSNHRATLQSAPRGGDLWIRYADGSLCNLTESAGFGDTGMQGAGAIAVRDPSVHWAATKAVFSMVVGAPTQRYQVNTYYWQLYEVSGWDVCEEVQITLVPNQPQNFNNVSPVYDSNDRIVFVSDRPRSGESHLYPQLDEYESTPTPTGLWNLDPSDGTLFLMNHSPSGSFDPFVDSFGRVLFTRWDHLQRDQQSDGDPDGSVYGTFDFASEAADATRSANRVEVFPEPRAGYVPAGQVWTGHRLNNFFPWQINQDGTGEEFVNHIGRHELHRYFNRARSDDPELVEFIDQAVSRANPNSIENFLQIREDPVTAGRLLGTDAPEFQTHASGQIIAMDSAPGVNPDSMVVHYVTHPDTGTTVPQGEAAITHTGHYREPLPLSDGRTVVSHTFATEGNANLGTNSAPIPRYEFRLRLLEDEPGAAPQYKVAGAELTDGISETISWWSPDDLFSYNGELWELSPVEVRVRAVPVEAPNPLPVPESTQFTTSGVEIEQLKAWMKAHNLGLLTVRDATKRDDADRQQPFNIRAPGGHTTTSGSGKIYDIATLRLYQGDQVRGHGGTASPRPGRRVLARLLHDAASLASNESMAPLGSVEVAADGSVAAFVPARRALAWETVDPSGEVVVRERFWITVQPGEIRACDGCHGVNDVDQTGGGVASEQEPLALLELLQRWNGLFADGFESGGTGSWSVP